jgi:hypothetical protein
MLPAESSGDSEHLTVNPFVATLAEECPATTLLDSIGNFDWLHRKSAGSDQPSHGATSASTESKRSHSADRLQDWGMPLSP